MKRRTVQRFPMLATIASESRDLESFARRADAWAASESHPPSTDTIIDAYAATMAPVRISRVALRIAIKRAADARIDRHAKLWADLADNINKGNDE